MMIRIDDGKPVDLIDFLVENDFSADKTKDIIDCMSLDGRYEGGGGASVSFTLTLADTVVTFSEARS